MSFNSILEKLAYQLQYTSQKPEVTWEARTPTDLCLYNTSVYEIPGEIEWTWIPVNARDVNADIIASKLILESLSYFRLVRFGDWVQEAEGSSSNAVRLLDFRYKWLSETLYSYLTRSLEEYQKYLDLVKALEEKAADPFLLGAIKNACDCISRRTYVEFGIDSQFITGPLSIIRAREYPRELIDRQLKALEVRFRSWYNSPEVRWSQEFDTQTDFLDTLYRIGPEAIAVQLSKEDLPHFHRLTINSITNDSNGVRLALNTRWNSLAHAAKECSAAGLYTELTLLAWKLHRLRNFYSLTAILQGIRLSGLRLAALDYLIDSGGNYMQYRKKMCSSPALHFLFPFSRTKNTTDVEKVVSAARGYTVRDQNNILSLLSTCLGFRP
ncbi:hypothetical protein BDV27DRAFT_165200 [Aspergillus caelatus]|uniref:Uncharacterized protein n=1 Tax=Aspergillus caelatus TaxID=61420 RepID=A0A5N7A1Z7_9EURO|nr:uncharacterized protein BDV27DRAFT_165200 [Aspergillus caelatus]KAE8363887.1 hypothetical protein BDV27DRAFT_165200 [Aspergillus caelatus]